MDPNELRNKVREAIEWYIDPGDWEQHLRIEKEERATTKRIAEALAGAK